LPKNKMAQDICQMEIIRNGGETEKARGGQNPDWYGEDDCLTINGVSGGDYTAFVRGDDVKLPSLRRLLFERAQILAAQYPSADRIYIKVTE